MSAASRGERMPLRALIRRIRVHPAMPLALVPMLLRGDPETVAAFFFALLTHEAGHALAAYCMGVRILEIELMPFGAALRLAEGWRLHPMQRVVVALAGPFASLCLFAIAVRMDVAPLRTANAALIAMNLLPALPLDGGRVLCALLSARVGEHRTTAIGIVGARIVAALLIACSVAGALLLRRINLSLLIFSGFLLAAAPRERLASGSASVIALIDRRVALCAEGTLPIAWIAARGAASIREVLPRLPRHAVCRLAVYDESLRLLGVVEEEALLRAALRDASAPLQKLLVNA